MIKVAVIDDHAVVLAGIKYMLSRDAEMEVVATSDDASDAVGFVRKHRPDVLLMDIRMPGTSGLEALDAVLAAEPDTKIGMLTTSEAEEDVYRSMTHGARGFIRKDSRGAELIAAVKSIAAGETYLPENMKAIFDMRAQLKGLSPREKECLELASRGLQNVEIAQIAGVSLNTLKYHMKNAYEKLGVTNRTEAVAEAIRRGIING
ncbi:MAG: response regulator transcription factor [Kiritimatiellae bacterium]|nr:response regulator transcription factor [Kiritimatiellia bacterium]